MAKTIRLKLKSDTGKAFTISMANPKPEIEEAGGKAIAQAVVDQLLEDQPLTRTIAECTGVDIVDRTVKKIL